MILKPEYQKLSDSELASLRSELKESSKDSSFNLLAHAFAATEKQASEQQA